MQRDVKSLGSRSGSIRVDERQRAAVIARQWNFSWKSAKSGEPGRNRTFNQQIKSLLLCQLSYGPGWIDERRTAMRTLAAEHSF